jgi:hypothetical protein
MVSSRISNKYKRRKTQQKKEELSLFKISLFLFTYTNIIFNLRASQYQMIEFFFFGKLNVIFILFILLIRK